MKPMTRIIFFAGIALGTISCNNDKTAEADTSTSDSTSTVTTEKMADTTTTAMATPIEVPVTTKTSFEKKYPKATNVRWVKYNPLADMDMAYYSDLDTSDYQVYFNNDNIDYTAWYYPDGRWIMTNYKLVNNADLPAAVNDAINKNYEGYSIVEIDKSEKKSGTVYELLLQKDNVKKKVHFSPTGAVLKEKTK
ncbi:MAG: PepSY-like domain-containing protein [Bacteroidota bacterium]|nr:PepSY-like domain-containing protein [Bacteroidota bacterium]